MQEEILRWFDENMRDLPWRKSDAWGVMVSEFMLQQTPVVRVLPKWLEWMERWPTPADLASAKQSDVITAWGRLGYPRRALRLHESAKEITSLCNGAVPREIAELQSLPGVGEYTAAAISAFAYGESTLVLDVNIRRLFARAITGVEAPRPSLSQIERAMARDLIPQEGAKWAAATMELGALICVARNPKCGQCPIANSCAWLAAGSPTSEVVKRTQSWHGTDRQCRGKIVQALRESNFVTRADLAFSAADPAQINRCLESLIADHLIEAAGNIYKLKD
jgi:A/G-specific adenine glycosylase